MRGTTSSKFNIIGLVKQKKNANTNNTGNHNVNKSTARVTGLASSSRKPAHTSDYPTSSTLEAVKPPHASTNQIRTLKKSDITPAPQSMRGGYHLSSNPKTSIHVEHKAPEPQPSSGKARLEGATHQSQI